MKKINLIWTMVLGILLVLTSFVSAHSGEDVGIHHDNMMSGMMDSVYGYGFMWMFGWLFMILVVVALVLLIVWLIKQITKNTKIQNDKRKIKKTGDKI